jgi:hypothetical protein
LFGLLSAGCLFWLEKLRPLFFTVAIGSMIYQGWAVWRRPPFLRTWGVKTILGISLFLNILVITEWIVLYYRYR